MNLNNKQSKNTLTPLQELLKRDVSRKEFVTITGLGVISLLGTSSIIRFLTGHHLGTGQQGTRGYGQRGYGE